MRERILCVNPAHVEETPSMVLFDEWAHCFGCGYRIPLSQLGAEHRPRGPAKPPENIEAELERIRTLPRARVRGLELPVDGEFYYILWPDGSYYKKRRFISDGGQKYLCPRGHKKPLFVPHAPKSAPGLFVVEGELNALSLAALELSWAICSPGGVGDFSEKILEHNSTFFFGYTRFHVILDKDKPGLEAAIRFKGLLMKRTPYVTVTLMEQDCNELLVAGVLKDEVQKWKMGM